MNRQQNLTYSASIVLILLPTVLAGRGEWALAALMLIVLIVAYHRAPNFRLYRSKTKRFVQFIIAANVLGLIVALMIQLRPAWSVLIIVLWCPILVAMLFWVRAGVKIESAMDDLGEQ